MGVGVELPLLDLPAGAAFKPFATIEREKLELTQGQDKLLVFGDEENNARATGVRVVSLFGGRDAYVTGLNGIELFDLSQYKSSQYNKLGAALYKKYLAEVSFYKSQIRLKVHGVRLTHPVISPCV